MKNYDSVKFKIILSLFIFLAVTTGLAEFFTASNVVDQISVELKENAINEAIINSDTIYDGFKITEENTFLISELIKNVTPISGKKDLKKLKDVKYLKSLYDKEQMFLKTLGQNTPLCTSIYFYYNNAYANNYDGAWFIKKNGDFESIKSDSVIIPQNSPWYYDPIKAQKGVWSNAYWDKDLKLHIITYSRPVYKNGVLLGVAGIDINLESLKNLVSSMNFSKNTSVFLTDANDNVIAGKNLVLGKNLFTQKKGFYKFLKKHNHDNNSRRYIEYKDHNVDSTISSVVLPNKYVLYINIPTSPIDMILENIIISIILINLIVFVIAAFLFIKIGNRISKPIINTLVENKNRQQAILDNIPCWAWMKDKDGYFIAVNKKFIEDLKIVADDIIGKTDFDIFPKEIAESLLVDDLDIINTQTHKIFYKYALWQGKEYWLETIKAPFFKKDGSIGGTVGLGRDVTERKRIEAENVQAKEQAELANKTKSIFLANMSHEIRTPMNSVLGFIQLLSQSELNEEQRDFVNEVKKSSDLLINLINDILDFSKLEAEKMHLEKISFDLRTVVNDSITVASSSAYKKGLSLNSLIYSEVPAKVVGDPDRLKQVLNNLINNAVKFTEKGEIFVTTRLLSYQEDSVKILFEVTDTGVGISQHNQEKIFELFTQADDSTTRKFGGTGLGLAISKKIIEMMNGTICIDSKLNEGSTFSFTAEFQIDKNQEKIIDSSLDKLKNIKVLVSDDNKTTLKVLRYYLEEVGIQVFETRTKIETLDLINKEKDIDVVIFDQNKLEKGGYEFANSIKSNPETKDIIIILHASYAERENSKKIREAGFFDYLPKPLSREDLLKCLINAIAVRQGGQVKSCNIESSNVIKDYNFNKKSQILVVEDNEINCKLMVKILNNAFLSCDIAQNGEEAIRRYSESDYDLILMDCQMPEVDGYEASKRIRQIEDGLKHTPIVAMTANAMDADRELCYAAGMDDYISKPIDINNLLGIIDKYINGIKIDEKHENDEDRENLLNVNTIVSEIEEKLNFTEEDSRKLLFEYITILPNSIKEIEIKLDENDFTSIKKIAHTIKGTSANLRIHRLAALSMSLENAGATENKELCATIAKEMSDYINILSSIKV